MDIDSQRNIQMTHHLRFKNMTTLLVICLIAASGCGKKDSDKVAEAQACLDSSDSTSALSCMSKVDGIESEAANLIRCSANFIFQEFTSPTRLTKIADQMKSSGGSASAAIGLLSFAKASGSYTATDLMNQTSTYCVASKSKGMILLSQMALVGTTLSTLVGSDVTTKCDTADPAYNAADCQTAVQDQVCSADSATLGTAAQTAYLQSCTGSSQSNSSVCQQFAAVNAGTTDPTTIGVNLQTQMNNNTTCPP